MKMSAFSLLNERINTSPSKLGKLVLTQLEPSVNTTEEPEPSVLVKHHCTTYPQHPREEEKDQKKSRHTRPKRLLT